MSSATATGASGRVPLRDHLRSGGVSIGPFLRIPAAEVTEIVGLAGLDHVIIDLEHSQFTISTAVDCARAASARGVHAVVRVADTTAAGIVRGLDLGASGIIVPGVTGIEDARRVVQHSRFHPLGARGMDVYARAAGWGATPAAEYLQRENDEVAVGVMVEGARVIRELDAIASIDGLDLLFVGPYDLSQSLGIPGQVDHTDGIETIEHAVTTARAHDKAVGLYVDSVGLARKYAELGVQFIGMATDADILRRSLADLREGLR